MNQATEQDRVIWRVDLQKACGVTSETIRRWLNTNKLPQPDVAMSRKTLGWKMSTLRRAGIDLA